MKVLGKQWYGAAVIALVLPTGWAFYRWVSSLTSSDLPSTFHGIRLGMSVSAVRSGFDAAGRFEARPNGESGWALDWRAATPGRVRSATFEFHEGLLVAVRAEVDREDSLASRLGTTLTPGVVRRVTRRNDGAFDVLILARSCPAHADEVRRLIEGT